MLVLGRSLGEMSGEVTAIDRLGGHPRAIGLLLRGAGGVIKVDGLRAAAGRRCQRHPSPSGARGEQSSVGLERC